MNSVPGDHAEASRPSRWAWLWTEPDVVLLDFQLPDSRDLQLLATVRRLAPRAAVILMSAYLTSEVARAAMAQGAHRVMTKPLDMNEVPALVHGAAARAVPLHAS